MKRASIKIPSDLEASLEAYRRDQEIPPALTVLVEAALREYLVGRGYMTPAQPLRITPAKKGSRKRDVSLKHDRYFAQA